MAFSLKLNTNSPFCAQVYSESYNQVLGIPNPSQSGVCFFGSDATGPAYEKGFGGLIGGGSVGLFWNPTPWLALGPSYQRFYSEFRDIESLRTAVASLQSEVEPSSYQNYLDADRAVTVNAGLFNLMLTGHVGSVNLSFSAGVGAGKLKGRSLEPGGSPNTTYSYTTSQTSFSPLPNAESSVFAVGNLGVSAGYLMKATDRLSIEPNVGFQVTHVFGNPLPLIASPEDTAAYGSFTAQVPLNMQCTAGLTFFIF